MVYVVQRHHMKMGASATLLNIVSNRRPIRIPKRIYESYTVNLGTKLISNRVPKCMTYFESFSTVDPKMYPSLSSTQNLSLSLATTELARGAHARRRSHAAACSRPAELARGAHGRWSSHVVAYPRPAELAHGAHNRRRSHTAVCFVATSVAVSTSVAQGHRRGQHLRTTASGPPRLPPFTARTRLPLPPQTLQLRSASCPHVALHTPAL